MMSESVKGKDLDLTDREMQAVVMKIRKKNSQLMNQDYADTRQPTIMMMVKDWGERRKDFFLLSLLLCPIEN